MMKSVENCFRGLINSAELLCTYAKQLKDAAQRGEEKEEITISREDLVIKNGSYKWVTNPGMDPDGPRFKKFNATHWGSMFKDIEWYRQKEFMVSTFVKTGNGFIMKGTQWRSNNFPYETMEESFDFFSTQSKKSCRSFRAPQSSPAAGLKNPRRLEHWRTRKDPQPFFSGGMQCCCCCPLPSQKNNELVN